MITKRRYSHTIFYINNLHLFIALSRRRLNQSFGVILMMTSLEVTRKPMSFSKMIIINLTERRLILKSKWRRMSVI